MNVHMIHMRVVFEDAVYTDGVDINKEQFYAKQAECKELPKTTQVNPQEYCDTFQPLLVEMEGCAIAQVCLRNNVRFVALKSVSDHLFSANQAEEYFDFGQALENLGKVLKPLAFALQKEEI